MPLDSNNSSRERSEEKYFHSWRTHDWALLESITSNKIIYNIQGKEPIIGHGGLREYWTRNSIRQKNLKVFQCLLDQHHNWSAYNFHTEFFHSLKKENQRVFGLINFKINEDGKIEQISEVYKKIVGEDFLPEVNSIDQQIKNYFKRLNYSKLSFKALNGLLLLFVILISLAACLFLISTNFLSETAWLYKLPYSEFWKNEEILEGSLKNTKKKMENSLGTIMAVSTVFLFIIDRWLKSGIGSNNLKFIKTDGTDEKNCSIMARNLKGANQASIFAGNFDFFKNHDGLKASLKKLDDADSLDFFSNETSESVTLATSSDPATTDIIRSLKRKGRFHFETGLGNLKATFWEKDGVPSLLYKHASDRMVRMRGIKENEQIILLLKGLMKTGPEAQDYPKVILITGETKSGKSHVCKILETQAGYFRLSVSGLVKEICQIESNSRNDLIKAGTELVKNDNDGKLLEKIHDTVTKLDKVVIDGLRIENVASKLKENFGSRMLTIYVDLNYTDQAARLTEAGETMSQKDIQISDAYFGVENIRKTADLILDGASKEKNILEKLGQKIPNLTH